MSCGDSTHPTFFRASRRSSWLKLLLSLTVPPAAALFLSAAVIGDTDSEEEPSALNFDFSDDEGEPFRGPAADSATFFIAWRRSFSSRFCRLNSAPSSSRRARATPPRSAASATCATSGVHTSVVAVVAAVESAISSAGLSSSSRPRPVYLGATTRDALFTGCPMRDVTSNTGPGGTRRGGETAREVDVRERELLERAPRCRRRFGRRGLHRGGFRY